MINPLNIRFSQPRIAPHFRAFWRQGLLEPAEDGHLIKDSAGEVFEAPLQDRAYAGAAAEDALEGVPSYDLAKN